MIFFWSCKSAYWPITSDICELLSILQFYYYRKCYIPFLLNVRWRFYVFYFYIYFALRSKIFSEKVCKTINKNLKELMIDLKPNLFGCYS